jgi:hypothetical protein
MEKAYAQLHGRYSALCGCLATHGAADGAGDAEGDAGCPGGGGGGGGGSAAGGSVAAALVDLTGGIPLKIKVDEEAGRVPCNSGMSHDDVGEGEAQRGLAVDRARGEGLQHGNRAPRGADAGWLRRADGMPGSDVFTHSRLS